MNPLRYLLALLRWTTPEQRADLDMDQAREEAVGMADYVQSTWPEDQGFGSSDFNAYMASYLMSLGYDVRLLHGRYTVVGWKNPKGCKGCEAGSLCHGCPCAPSVALSNLKAGTRVMGLAPIGIRWEGTVQRDGTVKPDPGCPAGEFVPTHTWVHSQRYEIRPEPKPDTRQPEVLVIAG